MNKPVSFAIGSVVIWTPPAQVEPGERTRTPPSNTTFSNVRGTGGQRVCVVTDAALTESGTMEYALEGSAWFNHEDLGPVDNPTEASLAYATRFLNDEDEDEDLDDSDTEGEDDDR